jgi:hypothetical protein
MQRAIGGESLKISHRGRPYKGLGRGLRSRGRSDCADGADSAGRQELLHGNAVAAFIVRHIGHVGFHQCEAAAARDLEAIGASAVRHCRGFESRSFVSDLCPESSRTKLAFNGDSFGWIFFVAVTDGIGDGLLKGHVHSEQIRLLPAEFDKLINDRLNEIRAGCSMGDGIAGARSTVSRIN